MKAAGKHELAQAFLFANVAQYRDELEGIVETLRIEKNRQKDDAIAALDTTTTAIAAATGAAITLLVAISLLLYRQITRPLSRMQTMMSEIASSQDFTRRVPVGRLDELGHSIVAFNGMIEKIQHSSLQLKQKTADIQAMLHGVQVVGGSNPLAPTNEIKDLRGKPWVLFSFARRRYRLVTGIATVYPFARQQVTRRMSPASACAGLSLML
jgi:methyl-accepting chemotaxis protein